MAEQKKQEVKIHFPKEIFGGVYANNLLVQHSKEEFIMDFIMLVPPTGSVTSRVITSPSQAKRIAHALQDNIAKYEKKFGEIKVPETSKADFDMNVYTKQ